MLKANICIFWSVSGVYIYLRLLSKFQLSPKLEFGKKMGFCICGSSSRISIASINVLYQCVPSSAMLVFGFWIFKWILCLPVWCLNVIHNISIWLLTLCTTTLQDIQTQSLDEEVSEFLQQPPQKSDAGLDWVTRENSPDRLCGGSHVLKGYPKSREFAWKTLS